MSRLVKINDGNVARAINQADNLLGTAPGTILLKGDHILTEQIRLNSNHELRLEKCTLTVSDDFVRAFIARNVNEGAIILADNCKVIGDGESRIVEPNNQWNPADPNYYNLRVFGHMIIQTLGATQVAPDGSAAYGITNDIELMGFDIVGQMLEHEGGIMSTIGLGNAHDVHIAYINLLNTSSLGITAGGWHPNHADNWIVEFCVFTGVASQALNVVNGMNITFRDDQFIDTGKLMPDGVTPYEGAACIDLEPNHPGDVIQNIDIERIYIHSGSSPFRPHGDGIIIQNGNQTLDVGPFTVKDCVIIGQSFGQDFKGRGVAAGILLADISRATVSGNYVQAVGQQGIISYDCSGLDLERNHVISAGSGGTNSFELFNTTDSNVANNIVEIDPRALAATDVLIETGTSDRNRFSGNTGNVILAGKNSKIETVIKL